MLTLIALSLILRKVKAGYDLGRDMSVVDHLLFMDDLKLYRNYERQPDTLINSVRIFSRDIRMGFGISKCAVVVMKKGKYTQSDGIRFPDQQKICEVHVGKGYKYLGVLEADGMKDELMKEAITKEYIRRVRKILKSKLNGLNTMTAINIRAVFIVRYSASIVKRTKDELTKMDTKTRKLLTVHRAFHLQGDIDRLYCRRKEGRRGLISVENYVETEAHSLRKYDSNSAESLL